MEEEKEIWVDVIGYEGYYQVSNMGRVKSLDRNIPKANGGSFFCKGKIIAIQYNKRTNVYIVMLNKNCERKAIALHQLVAQHFVHNNDPINKTTVNHKDGKRENNKYWNLEWDTYSENLQHSYDVLHRPVNIGGGKRPCKSINKETKEVRLYESLADASRNTKISETQIRRLIALECVNNNYLFEYI